MLEASSSAEYEYGADGTVFLRGAINFDTVGKLHQEVKFPKTAKSRVQIDWTEVELVDSSGVALCLLWIEKAQATGLKVVFSNVPEQMLRLISVNQVEALFDLS